MQNKTHGQSQCIWCHTAIRLLINAPQVVWLSPKKIKIKNQFTPLLMQNTMPQATKKLKLWKLFLNMVRIFHLKDCHLGVSPIHSKTKVTETVYCTCYIHPATTTIDFRKQNKITHRSTSPLMSISSTTVLTICTTTRSPINTSPTTRSLKKNHHHRYISHHVY